jgi:fructokinase
MAGPQPEHRGPHPGRPVIVGEVLFDVYPDGTKVRGGAPFDVAWHLQALDLRPLLITRVGADALGMKILREMREWDMDVSGVQLDPQHPTGQVRVYTTGRDPTFDICENQSYDHLDPGVEVKALAGVTPCLIYHGTLITRSETSAEAVYAYRARTAAPVFLDVNLRSPWWSGASVSRALLGARWLKLNADELSALAGAPAACTKAELVRSARDLKDKHALELVVVTLSEAGAFMVWQDQLLEGRPSIMVCNGDNMGAGDAFSAALIAGLIQGCNPETTLNRALDLAAVMCTVRGAVSHDRGLYQRLVDEWRAQQ